jgi:hypothetical protein
MTAAIDQFHSIFNPNTGMTDATREEAARWGSMIDQVQKVLGQITGDSPLAAQEKANLLEAARTEMVSRDIAAAQRYTDRMSTAAARRVDPAAIAPFRVAAATADDATGRGWGVGVKNPKIIWQDAPAAAPAAPPTLPAQPVPPELTTSPAATPPAPAATTLAPAATTPAPAAPAPIVPAPVVPAVKPVIQPPPPRFPAMPKVDDDKAWSNLTFPQLTQLNAAVTQQLDALIAAGKNASPQLQNLYTKAQRDRLAAEVKRRGMAGGGY